MEEVFQNSELSEIVEQSIVLRLEDDLTDSTDSRFMNGRMFRQLYPVDELPAVNSLNYLHIANSFVRCSYWVWMDQQWSPLKANVQFLN